MLNTYYFNSLCVSHGSIPPSSILSSQEDEWPYPCLCGVLQGLATIIRFSDNLIVLVLLPATLLRNDLIPGENLPLWVAITFLFPSMKSLYHTFWLKLIILVEITWLKDFPLRELNFSGSDTAITVTEFSKHYFQFFWHSKCARSEVTFFDENPTPSLTIYRSLTFEWWNEIYIWSDWVMMDTFWEIVIN